MVLKLKVPWREEHLPVCLPDSYDSVIHKIRDSGSPYVEQCDNDVDVLVKDFFMETNQVPDVSRYCIGEEGCCVHDDDRYRICNDKFIIRHCDIPESQLQIQQQPGSIVLLLESPHECEYEYIYRCFGCFARPFTLPKTPASGTTGDNIDLCLGTVLLHIQIETGIVVSDCHVESDYHVVISNPIQFQTSLHAIHGQKLDGKWTTLRDNVWRTLWDGSENHIKQCFQERLEQYHPKVIINACTSALKRRVTSYVVEWINGREPVVPLYEIAHPSNWKNLRPKLINPQANPNAGNSQ